MQLEWADLGVFSVVVENLLYISCNPDTICSNKRLSPRPGSYCPYNDMSTHIARPVVSTIKLDGLMRRMHVAYGPKLVRQKHVPGRGEAGGSKRGYHTP
jgi:hypothetical protein